MKKPLIFLLVLLGSLPDRTFAQVHYKDRIQLNVGNFIVPKTGDKKLFEPFVRNIGVSLQSKLMEHFSFGIAYNRWYNWHKLYHFISATGNGYYENTPFSSWVPGAVRTRFDYQMVDISVSYTRQVHHHEVYAGAGLSYTNGKNDIIVSVYQHPGYNDILVNSRIEKVHYVGITEQVGYNYLFLNNRINAGLSSAFRYYQSLPLQYYININLGYNFSLWRQIR